MATKCKSCGQSIKWIVTLKGKKSPVNVSDGLPHWGSCPDAKIWKKSVSEGG